MKVLSGTLVAALVVVTAAASLEAQQLAVAQVRMTEGAGSTIFGNYCENCHGNPKVDSAPPPAILKQMTPERIYQALTTGDMVTLSKDLTDLQKRDIAEWVGGRRLGAAENGDSKGMPNRCASNPPIRDLTSAPSWNGWSDINNTRFQAAKPAGLTVAAVQRLQFQTRLH